jgi:ABC-2 type transport system permease protein
MSSESPLRPTGDKGWLAGMKNMMRKENARWWAPKSLLLQAAIWLVIINSLVAFMLFVVPNLITEDDMTQINSEINNSTQTGNAPGLLDFSLEQVVKVGITIFFKLSSIAMLIGAVIICNDSIFKERESGTAAWVLSKPISRKAFVLSKFLANGIGVLLVIMLLQGIIAYALCSLKLGDPLDALPFIGGLALLGLNCLFYAFLAIALGAFSGSRGTTLGVPLLVMLGGMLLLQFIPDLGMVTPWMLGEMSSYLATTGSLPSQALLPIAATVLWIAAFAAATLWKFERIEL